MAGIGDFQGLCAEYKEDLDKKDKEIEQYKHTLEHHVKEIKLLTAEIDKKDERLEQLRKEKEWIAISERLPEDDSTVLIYTDHETTLMGIYAKCEKAFDVGNFNDYYDTWKVEDVTHWMSLPKRPQ